MALTGLARKVLARAHLLPAVPLDAIAPQHETICCDLGTCQAPV